MSKREDPRTLVYHVKVTLKDISPPVWRRLQVRGDTPLFGLHRILQHAMPWTNSHLHQFVVGTTFYGSPDYEFGREILSERMTTIREIAPYVKKRFEYEYDFGDGWEHEIVVEKILSPDPALRCPRCLGGARACPPEDCGGTGGYQRMLETLREPADPEYDDLLAWLGGHWDAEAFDLDEINRRLKRLRSLA